MDQQIMNDIIWKPVIGYEGLYEVSNIGFVKSLDKYAGPSFRSSRILTDQLVGRKNSQYPAVRLVKDNITKSHKIHILVLEAFVGPRPAGMNGLHKDDCRFNCRLENLYWGTQCQNMQDAKNNGHRGISSRWNGNIYTNR